MVYVMSVIGLWCGVVLCPVRSLSFPSCGAVQKDEPFLDPTSLPARVAGAGDSRCCYGLPIIPYHTLSLLFLVTVSFSIPYMYRMNGTMVRPKRMRWGGKFAFHAEATDVVVGKFTVEERCVIWRCVLGLVCVV